MVEISALKGRGIMEAAEAAIHAAKNEKTIPQHTFCGPIEHALAHIEELVLHDMPEEQQRWYAIKIFERDSKVLEQLNLSEEMRAHIEKDIEAAETEEDDDSESIITNERYIYIASIIKGCYKKVSAGKLTISDKIDRIVTNRILALPIFAVIMFIVYYISVTTVGTVATDWANDGVFGDGWHLFGIGSSAYSDVADEYNEALTVANGFITYESEQGVDTSAVEAAMDAESEDYDPEAAKAALTQFAATIPAGTEATYSVEDEETLATEDETAAVDDLTAAMAVLDQNGYEAPDPANYGVWIPGIPVFVEKALTSIGCADWLSGLILDGIVAGVGAVLATWRVLPSSWTVFSAALVCPASPSFRF